MDFGAWVLAPLLDCPVAVAEDVIEQLVDAQLVETAGQRSDGYQRYRLHDLLRALARERLREQEPVDVRHAARDRYLRALVALTRTAHESLNPGSRHLTDDGTATGLDRGDPALSEPARGNPAGWLATEYEGVLAAADLAYQAGSGS